MFGSWLGNHRKFLAVAALLLVGILLSRGSLSFGTEAGKALPRFIKHVVDAETRAESCAVADVNQDGRLDIISGEYWYEAPQWQKHQFRTIPVFVRGAQQPALPGDGPLRYVDDMGAIAFDVNGDNYPDVISGSWHQKIIVWYENPAARAHGGNT